MIEVTLRAGAWAVLLGPQLLLRVNNYGCKRGARFLYRAFSSLAAELPHNPLPCARGKLLMQFVLFPLFARLPGGTTILIPITRK